MGIKASPEQIKIYKNLARDRGGRVEDRQSHKNAMADALAERKPTTHGRFEIWVPGWKPTSLNRLMYAKVSHRIKLKAYDSEMVGIACHLANVPKAACKRRVSLEITLGPRWRQYDDDNAWKAVLDGLVSCKRLVDDNAVWMERGSVIWHPRKSGACGTMIILQDCP